MNKRLVCLLTIIITFAVLIGCGNAPGQGSSYHFAVHGHRAVLSTDFVGSDEDITISVDGCISPVPDTSVTSETLAL
jgi:hypothetical protein